MVAGDRKWIIATGGVLAVVVTAPPLVLLGPLGLGNRSMPELAAVLVFAGVLVTACVSLIGHLVTRQSDRRLSQESDQAHQRLQQEHEDEQRRLKLDAAMRAGELFSATDSRSANPAALASGLLALTKLDHADLAVALLVDLWSGDNDKISTETAVLVIDAALRSSQSNAQLVAAELLCRNAKKLDSCQSLHWPSAVDGCWIPKFGPKTKLLVIDALVLMSLSNKVTENALRSVAVRLYGVWRDETGSRVKGCVGMLISALTPELGRLGYTNFMQGNQEIMLSDLERAAASATTNPDGFLDQLVADRCKKLADWAGQCSDVELGPGSLATAVQDPPTARSPSVQDA
ncbi:MAG: hypothetical protein JWL97_4391 [Gemmatimonadales bacterium]|jgi:hypothetical protein|nr:hypothetical protein [Gemmatimonadales bacterium]